MKKLSLLFTAVAITAIVFTGCKKKETGPSGGSNETAWFEPEQKQRSLMFNFTATWCTYCGVWGHPTFHSAETSLGDNALPFAIQGGQSELSAVQYKPSNDTPYYARHLSEFTSSLQGITVGGYPTLCVNNKSGYAGGSQATMVNDANAFNSISPVANIEFGITKNATGFVAKTTTKFFKETNGEYYITMFITQNGINHRQNVGGTYQNSYTHDNIIRAYPITNAKETAGSLAGLNKTFGKAIISGSIAAGKFVNTELTYVADNKTTMMPSGWNVFMWDQNNTSNLFVTAIVWKKEDSGKFTFVNGVRKPI